LGYVVFVPWLIAACTTRSKVWAYLGTYLLGAAFMLFHFRWLFDTTPEGYVAASLLYLAMFFPLAAWALRQAWHRRIPLVVAFPVIWTGFEILRAHNPLGFPWFLLGHSQIHLLPMVQIADFAGVYGVTFVVAMANGLVADALLTWIVARRGGPAKWRPILAFELPAGVIVLAATIGYGAYRLSESRFTDGPLTAVLQGDFLLRADPHDTGASEASKEAAYLAMVNQVIAEHPDLDLVVLPETPWTMYLNREMRLRHPSLTGQHERWVQLTAEHKLSVVVGAMSEEPQPKGTYPSEYRYNSAFLYTPGDPEPQRYDKIHLVPFGEYVPFRYGRLHWLYCFLNDGPWNPWGRPQRPGDKPFEYSLTAGKDFTVLKLPQSASGHNGRFGVTICYEDVIPQIFRRFVGSPDGTKRVDFMMNISNDGWFGHGNQQPQHLVNCAFRAIENRVGIARAVNTGVSGFIDPDGRWRDLMSDPPQAGGSGVRVARIMLDPRVTFYSLHGDVFGFACLALTLVVCGDAVVGWWRGGQRVRKPGS
jgi:apolipoprotein N-acyltransferase